MSESGKGGASDLLPTKLGVGRPSTAVSGAASIHECRRHVSFRLRRCLSTSTRPGIISGRFSPISSFIVNFSRGVLRLAIFNSPWDQAKFANVQQIVAKDTPDRGTPTRPLAHESSSVLMLCRFDRLGTQGRTRGVGRHRRDRNLVARPRFASLCHASFLCGDGAMYVGQG